MERCTSVDEVDAILAEDAKTNKKVETPEHQEALRARVRRQLRGGKSALPVAEERGDTPAKESKAALTEETGSQENYNGLGVSLTSLQKLSGM